jgi:hypothetical protein
MQWCWGDTSGSSGRQHIAVMIRGRWERSPSSSGEAYGKPKFLPAMKVAILSLSDAPQAVLHEPLARKVANRGIDDGLFKRLHVYVVDIPQGSCALFPLNHTSCIAFGLGITRVCLRV